MSKWVEGGPFLEAGGWNRFRLGEDRVRGRCVEFEEFVGEPDGCPIDSLMYSLEPRRGEIQTGVRIGGE